MGAAPQPRFESMSAASAEAGPPPVPALSGDVSLLFPSGAFSRISTSDENEQLFP